MSPTVPPTSTTMTSAWLSSASASMRSLIPSVTCGMAWIVPPEELALPLAGDHFAVYLARGHVGRLAQVHVYKALVVPEVQVRLPAVPGDEDFAVLIRGHCPGVDVEVRVQLQDGDGDAAALKYPADGGDAHALADGANDTACHENEPGHPGGRAGHGWSGTAVMLLEPMHNGKDKRSRVWVREAGRERQTFTEWRAAAPATSR